MGLDVEIVEFRFGASDLDTRSTVRPFGATERSCAMSTGRGHLTIPTLLLAPVALRPGLAP